MSLNNGGVYTYGAPLVVHAFDQAKNSAACTHMQQQMDLSRVSSASMQLPVHSFVNGMDLVPRLRDRPQLRATLDVLKPALPAFLRQAFNEPGSFVPVGMVYLLIGDSISAIDTAANAAALEPADAQLYRDAIALLETRTAKDAFVLSCLQDHALVSYTEKLEQVLASVVPILFVGGTQDDYEALAIKRMSSSGTVHSELALRHKKSNVISHSSFQHVRVQAVIAAVAATAAGAVALAKIQKVAGTLHPVSLVQHLLSEGRNCTSVAGKVAVLAPAAMTVAKTVLPTIGRLVGGHMLHSTAQAAGVGLVCPPLAAVSLGASVLNACMTGYTIYQLHGISSHLGKMDGKLDSVVTSSARMEASLVNLTGSAQHITSELDTVKLMTQAIDSGIQQLHHGMQQQTAMLQQVMKCCDKLGEGQAVIIEYQRALLDAVGTVGREGKEGTKKILDAMHIQRMQSLQEKMDLFQNCMKDHLRKPGDAHKAAALRARSFELQASAKSWAAELADDTNPVHIVGRQSFLMMHCLAAVGLDAASSAQECFQQDVREHRLEALQRVDADILVLLRSTTPYLIATVYQVALAQLVYLRRAMMSTTDIAQVYSCVSDSSRPQSTAVVHSANDLLWLDGLHGIRQLFQRSAADDAAEHQPLGSFFALVSLQDLTWYCGWKQLSAEQAVLIPVPVVQVPELLDVIGVPPREQKAAMQHLRKTDLQSLQQMALPEYLADAVACLEEQLPGLGLAAKHTEDTLFARPRLAAGHQDTTRSADGKRLASFQRLWRLASKSGNLPVLAAGLWYGANVWDNCHERASTMLLHKSVLRLGACCGGLRAFKVRTAPYGSVPCHQHLCAS
ncbi:TPA: hypothetical protein ACH3X2_005743 [Trebouxia sp. C0005]